MSLTHEVAAELRAAERRVGVSRDAAIQYLRSALRELGADLATPRQPQLTGYPIEFVAVAALHFFGHTRVVEFEGPIVRVDDIPVRLPESMTVSELVALFQRLQDAAYTPRMTRGVINQG